MAYSELIKNFERIRAYMRDFYLYGFKTREGYERKSLRSYDDEKRRIESWLSEHMDFVRTSEGKNVFISIDSRIVEHNPLFKAWKAKSFTDGDITLHFILFDIMTEDLEEHSLPEILDRIDNEYLNEFSSPTVFDESTVRKKLKEYIEEGIVVSRKEGRRVLYRRAEATLLPDIGDALSYFSETLPLGAVGSFLLDKSEYNESFFRFKHHYIIGTLDSAVIETLFTAMREKRFVKLKNKGRRTQNEVELTLAPLKVFISVQSGRQHLLAYQYGTKKIKSYRIDYLTDAELSEPFAEFDAMRERLSEMQKYMWGVNYKGSEEHLESVEFTVKASETEDYIVNRLHREKRGGTVDMIDKGLYRFSARVFDICEMLPWIRTFICRIVSVSFSNKAVEEKFKNDLIDTYRLYGLDGGEQNDIQ